MPTGRLQVELVHDPYRNRVVIGSSADPALVSATAAQLLFEAEQRARQFAGIDDIYAAEEQAEVHRLREILDLILPEGAEGGG